MSATNPLSFLGGMVLEVGAAIAVLAVLLPGSSPASRTQLSPEPNLGPSPAQAVFYTARPVQSEAREFAQNAARPAYEPDQHLWVARSILPSTPCEVPEWGAAENLRPRFQAEPAVRRVEPPSYEVPSYQLPSYRLPPVELRAAVRTGMFDSRY